MSKTRAVPTPADVSPYIPVGLSPPRPYRDLCSTCSHSAACGSRSTPEHPILFCELFEVQVLLRAPATAPVAALPERSSGGQGAAERKGLCANCENLQTCTIARPEGGVWHCEEYR